MKTQELISRFVLQNEDNYCHDALRQYPCLQRRRDRHGRGCAGGCTGAALLQNIALRAIGLRGAALRCARRVGRPRLLARRADHLPLFGRLGRGAVGARAKTRAFRERPQPLVPAHARGARLAQARAQTALIPQASRLAEALSRFDQIGTARSIGAFPRNRRAADAPTPLEHALL